MRTLVEPPNKEGGGGRTAKAWKSSAEARVWERNCQGVEAPRPLYLAQKYTQKGKSNSRRHQEKARNTGRERGIHKGRETEEHDTNHSGPAGDWAPGQGQQGGGRADDGGRFREERTLGHKNPWG